MKRTQIHEPEKNNVAWQKVAITPPQVATLLRFNDNVPSTIFRTSFVVTSSGECGDKSKSFLLLIGKIHFSNLTISRQKEKRKRMRKSPGTCIPFDRAARLHIADNTIYSQASVLVFPLRSVPNYRAIKIWNQISKFLWKIHHESVDERLNRNMRRTFQDLQNENELKWNENKIMQMKSRKRKNGDQIVTDIREKFTFR